MDYVSKMTCENFLALSKAKKSTIFFITEIVQEQMLPQDLLMQFYLRFDRLPSVGNCYNQSHCIAM